MNIEVLVNLVEKADRDFQLALVPADIVEKFAELIVRECVEQLDDGDSDNYWAIKRIKQHFGV